MNDRDQFDWAGSRRLAIVQGLFYVVSGVWPIAHIQSFEAVTGPKADRWLVKTVGVLVGVVGAVLLHAARHSRVTPEVRLLASGCAGGLAAIDVVYVAKRRISPIYLLDAVAELAIAVAWVVTGGGRLKRRRLR